VTGRRYVKVGTVPKSIGPGRKLMHNHIIHTIDMPCGVNGFRCWTDTKVPAGFVRCPCGWSGLPHYAARGHVKATKGKCLTLTKLERLVPGTTGAIRDCILSQ
jgi:hypothetical protein